MSRYLPLANSRRMLKVTFAGSSGSPACCGSWPGSGSLASKLTPLNSIFSTRSPFHAEMLALAPVTDFASLTTLVLATACFSGLVVGGTGTGVEDPVAAGPTICGGGCTGSVGEVGVPGDACAPARALPQKPAHTIKIAPASRRNRPALPRTAPSHISRGLFEIVPPVTAFNETRNEISPLPLPNLGPYLILWVANPISPRTSQQVYAEPTCNAFPASPDAWLDAKTLEAVRSQLAQATIPYTTKNDKFKRMRRGALHDFARESTAHH